MLVLSRSTRAAHILRLHARALSTEAHSAGAPSTDAEPFTPAPDKAATTQQPRLANSGAECMFVHPWNRIHSSAEGFAIARAVQEKYGVAKEVLFPRDPDSVNLFQPYFWLVFDDPNVRKLLPEGRAQFTVQVADTPRSDYNIGLEEMMRGMGVSTSDSNDPHHEPPPPAETEPYEKSYGDAVPEGYKAEDVRVEWAEHGPGQLLGRRRRASAFHPNERILPFFATAWVAFDGFSPESARGPHTPNLLRARNKWRDLAPASALGEDDGVTTTTTTEAAAVGPVEVEVGATANFSSREWVPIVPSSEPHTQRRPRPATAFRQNNSDNIAPATTAPDGPPPTTTLTADAANTTNDTTDAAPTFTPTKSTPAGKGMTTGAKTESLGFRLKRRERILHLARQNARTPLPKLAETPQPPTKAEKLDEESERQGRERTIRERLWRLVGGNY